MNHILEFLWRPILPIAAVAASCLGVMLAAFAVVQMIEAHAGQPGPFDLQVVPLGNASFVVLACAGMCIVVGIATARWSFLFMANVVWRHSEGSYGLNWAFPLGNLLAAGLIFTGAAIVLFYVCRATSS